MIEKNKIGLVGYALIRGFGWSMVSLVFIFVFNTFLTLSQEWPGINKFLASASESNVGRGYIFWIQGMVQTSLYLGGIFLPFFLAFKKTGKSLRHDAKFLCRIVNYFIRSCFWAVLLVGLTDAIISFLRVEDLLIVIFDQEFATQLGRSRFRGPYIHIPLVLIGFVIGAFIKNLAFMWLSLLVVFGELSIVITRFVFSYEQAFQGDIIRFWYAALFLFSSAYTLYQDGHVRVDVLYTHFDRSKRGIVNAIGSVVLGMSLCWAILLLGMWEKTNIIVNPLLNYESAQAGFGMYTKYWLAAFLAVFAISMLIQFTSYFFESVADYNKDPGQREITSMSSQ